MEQLADCVFGVRISDRSSDAHVQCHCNNGTPVCIPVTHPCQLKGAWLFIPLPRQKSPAAKGTSSSVESSSGKSSSEKSSSEKSSSDTSSSEKSSRDQRKQEWQQQQQQRQEEESGSGNNPSGGPATATIIERPSLGSNHPVSSSDISGILYGTCTSNSSRISNSSSSCGSGSSSEGGSRNQSSKHSGVWQRLPAAPSISLSTYGRSHFGVVSLGCSVMILGGMHFDAAVREREREGESEKRVLRD